MAMSHYGGRQVSKVSHHHLGTSLCTPTAMSIVITVRRRVCKGHHHKYRTSVDIMTVGGRLPVLHISDRIDPPRFHTGYKQCHQPGKGMLEWRSRTTLRTRRPPGAECRGPYSHRHSDLGSAVEEN